MLTARLAPLQVRAAAAAGVRALSVYAFSTENWARPEGEVAFLLALLERALRTELAELKAEGVCVRIVGDTSRMPPALAAAAASAAAETEGNDRLHLLVAVGYGGRQELAAAAARLAARVERGEMGASEVDEAALEAELSTSAALPEVRAPRLPGAARSSGQMLLAANARV